MRKNHSNTMGTKLICGFCLLSFVILALSAVWLLNFYSAQTKGYIRGSLKEISEASAAQIEANLDNVEQAGQDIISYQGLDRYITGFLKDPADAENNRQLLAYMTSAYKNRNDIRRVILVSSSGAYLATGAVDPDEGGLREIMEYAYGLNPQVHRMSYYRVVNDYMDRTSESRVLTGIMPIVTVSGNTAYIMVQQNIRYYGNSLTRTLDDYPIDVIITWKDSDILYSSFVDAEQTRRYAEASVEYSNNKETEESFLAIEISPHRQIKYTFILDKSATSARMKVIFTAFGEVLLLICVCTIIYITLLTRRFTRPIHEISKHMKKWNFDAPEYEKLNVKTTTCETELLLEAYQEMIKRQRDIRDRNRQLEVLQERTLFSALQSEISPHFMFNTLGSIAEICEKNGDDEAAEHCYGLASILRYSSSFATAEVLLQQELENLEAYLKLMKIRYRERLDYSLEFEDKAGFLYIPKLTLQPLVENCIKYSIVDTQCVRVRVHVAMEGSCVVISIRDNGSGISREAAEKVAERFDKIRDRKAFQEVLEQTQIGNMGLSGTLIRLKLFYKDKFGYELHGEGSGTEIKLIIVHRGFM